MRDDGTQSETLESATTSDADTGAETAGDVAPASAGSKTGPIDPAQTSRPVRLGAGDRYVIGRVLGRGGMGEVLAASDEQVGREVAVKRMLRQSVSERAKARFFREASIQGRLDHPAIVPVHEIGTDDDGRPFFVMKRLTGTSMSQLITDNASRTRLLRAFAEVCLAVEFAHTRRVVHRDLKPDNILLGEFGEVYVIDWGVAKIQETDIDDSAAQQAAEFTAVQVAELHTAYGVAIGTPGYMAPEQVRGARDLDGRADVYSLGCVLFEILTGEMMHPRGDAGMASALEGTAHRPSTRAIGRDIPPELDALCLHATAPDRNARVLTARSLGERVQLYLDGDRDVAMRRQLAAEHLLDAREAFTRGDRDGASRAMAMREAGRALALDPTLAGAAELLTRLMLEPPRVVPPEVVRELGEDKLASIRRHSTTGMRGFIGYLALLPILFATGEQRVYAIALVVAVALNVGLLYRRAHMATLTVRAISLAAANAALIVILGLAFSPFVIAPGIATVTASALVFGPVYERRASVIACAALLVAALLGPWLAELAGWLPATTTFTAHGLDITSPGLRISEAAKVAVLVLTTIAMVAAAAGMSFRMCAADRAARKSLHLQAWQLRQLVPEQARAATVT